jgi:hypothetical protein
VNSPHRPSWIHRESTTQSKVARSPNFAAALIVRDAIFRQFQTHRVMAKSVWLRGSREAEKVEMLSLPSLGGPQLLAYDSLAARYAVLSAYACFPPIHQDSHSKKR